MSTLKVTNIKSETGNSSMTVHNNGQVTIPGTLGSLTASGTLTVSGTLATTGAVSHTNIPVTSTRPMFHAYGSGTQTLSGTAAYHTAQIGNGTWENIGGHYNTSNYKFTCPVAGQYFFANHWATGTNNSTGGVSYIVNETTGSWRSEAIGYGDYYDGNYNSCIMTCSANDLILIKFGNYNDVTVAFDLSRAFFSGYLIG